MPPIRAAITLRANEQNITDENTSILRIRMKLYNASSRGAIDAMINAVT
ncbi:hypothetical protein PVK73_22505 [Bacillus thuringiensis]